MSEFKVQVVRLTGIEKHPNADSLSIVKVNGDYPVVFQTSGFSEGDLAVYVPIDSVVPDTEEWAFLGGHRRIKAKKLRGVFSMGMLAPLPNDRGGCPPECHDYELKEGDDVQALMGITKYEPVIHAGTIRSQEVMSPDEVPPWFPRYTDIEGLRKNGDVLVEGEEVVITEKIHGANGRWASEIFDDMSCRLFVGSHNQVFKEQKGGMWLDALLNCPALADAVTEFPKFVFFGEVFGKVQDLRYGLSDRTSIRIFDVFDGNVMQYLDYDVMMRICDVAGVPTVPLLYRGPWSNDLRTLAEGPTTITPQGLEVMQGHTSHVREGFVVRPVKERFDRRVGRVVLKCIGEGYMLRKGA